VVSHRLDQEVVELERRGNQLVAVRGDGQWDAARGLAVDPSDDGLDLLPGFTSFPADYVTFFPDGFFWQPSGLVPAAE